MAFEREGLREFEREFSEFTSNISKILDDMHAFPELRELFSEACEKYDREIESIQRQLHNPELDELLQKELNFFNRFVIPNSRRIGAVKTLGAAQVILESIGKHLSHWAIDILQEILKLVSLFSVEQERA